VDYVIETFSLTKVFSDWWGSNKVYAVNNLNLKIANNEVFGLLGPNGSGKTTTLKMLLGLLHPTKGKALVLGGDSTNPKISARIGFLPEESYLYRYLNARETLDFYGRLFALPSKIRKSRIEALLDMVGLKAVANRPVGQYSKGMARRIGLAQALINDPDLLILDEPTTGLDPIGTRQIKDLILKLAKRGKTILLCSHLLADVEDVCDRIAILYGGKIQAHGKVKDLLEQTDKREIVTGSISDDVVGRIKEILRRQNAECMVKSPMERLEAFFIKTVTAAQQQDQATSGAISTTQIGQFLTDVEEKSVIEKLVSASVSDEEISTEPVKKKQTQPPESAVSEPDDRFLQQLTETAEIDTEPAAETKPVTPVEPAKKQQTDENILDRLTDDSDVAAKQKQQPADRQGESEDA